MGNPIKIETATAMANSLLCGKDFDLENLRNLLDKVCSQVADKQ